MSTPHDAQPDAFKHAVLEGIRQLQGALGRLPGPVSRDLEARIDELRQLLLEQRPARFMLVGRRGSGKSSLVNAIFGEPVAQVGHETAQTGAGRWWPYSSALGTLEILDTRGLQEGSRPDEDDDAVTPVESILRAVGERAPDAIVFVVKAKEIDAALDGDLKGLCAVSDHVSEVTGYRPPIVGVVTHCDELEPKFVRLHTPDLEDPEDLAEKEGRVRRIEGLLLSRLRSYGRLRESVVTSLGVCAYLSWRRDGGLRADERWRIGELLGYLMHELPTEARVEFARLSQIRTLQRDIAEHLTVLIAAICAGIAAVPLPIADMVPISSLQTSLISGIAYISGRQAEVRTAREFLGAVGVTLGAGVVFREVTRALLKMVSPGAGNLISAGVAYAATVGVGRAATAYFLDQTAGDSLRDVYTDARAAARASFDPAQHIGKVRPRAKDDDAARSGIIDIVPEPST